MSEETVTKPEAVEPVGEVSHEAILKQVEFYFSDQNLPKDKFLYQNTQKNDGWVPISVIAQFKRMQQFRPVEKIVSALKKSEELLEVSEDGESVRRKKPLVEPKKEDKINAFSRSVYAKGFPDETDGLQMEIEKFFQAYGLTNEVRLRRTEDKKFKNSVFVEFANLEDAEKFLAAEPKPKYGDSELLTMSKKAYVDMKSAEHGFTQNANGKRKRFNAFNEKKHHHNNNNNNNNNNDRKRRNFNRNDNRGSKRSRNDEKREDGEKATESTAEKPAEPVAAAEKPNDTEAKE